MSQNIEIERRLAAVLAADVAGFSRLTEADEVGTIRMLAAQRAILDAAIARHRGRIANTAGDSVLAEFPSAVNAVQCAVEVQQALRDSADGVADDKRVLFRIGIHVGDVMVRGGDLLGSGVNVAARLEALADAGGIVISAAAHEQVKKILPLAYTDLGPQRVKNIEEPVRAFAIGSSPASATAYFPNEGKPLPLPDKPSIAVLPFQNMSGDPEQEYFADGMVEDIITALSRFKTLFVIARNSSFTYKGRAVDIKQVGRELGVRYVLEGSVRKAGAHLRITAQLIEAETNKHVWADKYDGNAADVFALQDSITERVAVALSRSIVDSEVLRHKLRGTGSAAVNDLYYRGLEQVRLQTKESNELASKFARQAIDLDPTFVSAYILTIWACNDRYANRWTAQERTPPPEIFDIARQLQLLAANDSAALSILAWFNAVTLRDLDSAEAFASRSIALNENNPAGWTSGGHIAAWRGDYEEGERRFQHAMRLNPVDLLRVESGMCGICLFTDRSLEAMAWIRRALTSHPHFAPSLRLAIATHVACGQIEEAKKTLQHLRQLDPHSTVTSMRPWVPWRIEKDREFFLAALKAAGLPE